MRLDEQYLTTGRCFLSLGLLQKVIGSVVNTASCFHDQPTAFMSFLMHAGANSLWMNDEVVKCSQRKFLSIPCIVSLSIQLYILAKLVLTAIYPSFILQSQWMVFSMVLLAFFCPILIDLWCMLSRNGITLAHTVLVITCSWYYTIIWFFQLGW